MPENHNIAKLFDQSGNLTPQALERFLAGRLPEEEMAMVERHLQTSPFDREALEGFRGVPQEKMADVVAGLNARISEMAGGHQATRRSLPVKRQYWAAAATLLSLVSLTALLLFLFHNNIQPTELATARPDTATLRPDIRPPSGAATIPSEPPPAMTTETLPPANAQQAARSDDREKDVAKPETPSSDRPPIDRIHAVHNVAELADDNPIEADQKIEILRPELEPEPEADDLQAPAIQKENKTSAGKVVGAARTMILAEEAMEDEAAAEIFMVVEQMPEFPGGTDSLFRFLARNITYPAAAREQGIQGRVFVSFVVEKDGAVTHVKVIRGIGGGCDEEAVRVVEMMPDWIPATQRGKPVRVQYNLPIKFSLDSSRSQ